MVRLWEGRLVGDSYSVVLVPEDIPGSPWAFQPTPSKPILKTSASRSF